MLGKENVNNQNQKLETIIGPSVKVKGNFNSQGNVKIEGALDGNLNTAGNVQIGIDAKIKANITACIIHISGNVTGTLSATEKIVLTADAKITGDIETKILIIEDGAFFSGKCVMGNDLMKKNIPPKTMEKTLQVEDKK